jgi:putative transposase
MILIADRRSLAQDIQDARDAGARLEPVCEVAGIDARTLQRWKAQEGLTKGDGRPAALHPTPAHALSEDERANLLGVANEARFCAVPPARIVTMLADEGVPRHPEPNAHPRPTSLRLHVRFGAGI